MKLFAVFALLSAASANPLSYYYTSGLRVIPLAYGSHSSSLITPTQQQYQTQDDLGQYSYGYTEPLSAKQEVRTLDGITRGSYSYRDAEGKLQTVDYRADAEGFHVAATNLPVPVKTPETSANTPSDITSRSDNLASYEQAKLQLDNSGRPADSDVIAVEASAGSVELSKPLANTYKIATIRSNPAVIPAITYQPIPKVVSYAYPLRTHYVTPTVYY